jgi:hypothetical protein
MNENHQGKSHSNTQKTRVDGLLFFVVIFIFKSKTARHGRSTK